MKWWNTFWGELFLRVATVIVALGIIFTPISIWAYTQRLVKDSETTATKGLFFKVTVDLTQYKKLGLGNGLYGKYESYSRSDRHGDVLTVYIGETK